MKKIGFFTFAFFLPSLFPAVAILTGAILQFFQHSIFTPAPYVFHTPPILKNLISHSHLPILHPLLPHSPTTFPNPNSHPNPHPSQSKNNAISLQITTSIYQAKNKSKPQHNKKHSQIDPNHSTC